jgi:hypothetical protein
VRDPVEERAGRRPPCGTVPDMRTQTGWSGLARPVLRSGLHVVRRDDAHLQIGLDEPDRLVLRDRPGLYAALTALERPPAPELRPVLERLVAEGWVVDAAEPSRRARARAERRPPIALESDALARDAVTRASVSAGLRVSERAAISTPLVTLVVTLGEPRRRVSDRLVRDDVPHLWLTVLPESVRVGPFVEPGRTPCLRCVDARLGERDLRRATVLHQLDDLPVAPHPVWDPSLLDLGAAWAVRDVVRRLDGEPPALRSVTVTVTADLGVTRHEWLRHPHCGCAWG